MRVSNKEYQSRYCERHPDRRNKSCQEYLSKYPERRQATIEKYRMNNLEKVRLAAKKWAKKDYELNGRSSANDWEARNKQRVKTNKRIHHLRKCYDLSEKDFLALLHKQENRCPICQLEFAKTPSVDHDNKTGIVRGLLCRTCNSGLGIFKDNPDILRNAISYLCG